MLKAIGAALIPMDGRKKQTGEVRAADTTAQEVAMAWNEKATAETMAAKDNPGGGQGAKTTLLSMFLTSEKELAKIELAKIKAALGGGGQGAKTTLISMFQPSEKELAKIKAMLGEAEESLLLLQDAMEYMPEGNENLMFAAEKLVKSLEDKIKELQAVVDYTSK